jgi:hypothetical protein
MMPALLIIGIGGRSRRLFPLPLPVFLLWPLVLFALALVWLAERLLRLSGADPSWLRAAKVGLLAFFHLSGFRIEVESSDGTRLRVLLV